MTNNLTEGMRAKDLEDLVLPMISVDEYESKISDDAFVFGFYVNDHDAAEDLNRFIQKSPVKLLDTEVSPAPDQRGFYMVFLEISDNAQLPQAIDDIVEEVSPLVCIDHWQMQIRGVDDLVPFSKANLAKHLGDKNRGRKKGEKKVEEQVLDFLRPSGLSGAEAADGRLVLEGMGQKVTFGIVAFGSTDGVVSSLTDSPLDMALTDIAKEIRVSRMLGEGWSVVRSNGLCIIQHEDSEDALVLRDR